MIGYTPYGVIRGSKRRIFFIGESPPLLLGLFPEKVGAGCSAYWGVLAIREQLRSAALRNFVSLR